MMADWLEVTIGIVLGLIMFCGLMLAFRDMDRAREDRRALLGLFTCEVCKRPTVERKGPWDYCAHGHVYVGERVEI